MHTDNHISDRSKPLEVVGGLFSEDYLKRFRVFNPRSLFPPTPEEYVLDISKNKCPIYKRKSVSISLLITFAWQYIGMGIYLGYGEINNRTHR